jgi:predicted RNA-binding protein with TRAM domain
MVEISDSLRTLFTGVVEERDGEYVVVVPSSEVEHGELTSEETYRVGLVGVGGDDKVSPESHVSEGRTQGRESVNSDQPPVVEGETYQVEIESMGDQGDGVAYVDGFVVMVSDVKIGECVVVKVETVLESVAFADVVKRVDPNSSF